MSQQLNQAMSQTGSMQPLPAPRLGMTQVLDHAGFLSQTLSSILPSRFLVYRTLVFTNTFTMEIHYCRGLSFLARNLHPPTHTCYIPREARGL